VVNVVSMAYTSRNDEALSASTRPLATRRWLLVIAAVLAPIALGAVATLALFVTRHQPVPQATSASPASDIKGYDGSVLVLQPLTTAQVRIPLGITLEVVLHPNVGQDIESVNSNILMQTSNPPCHVKALCGFPGAEIWTFRAIDGGVGYLKIIFGFYVCHGHNQCTRTPLVYKPIAVYSRPQSS
jgi:hypothetical protein